MAESFRRSTATIIFVVSLAACTSADGDGDADGATGSDPSDMTSAEDVDEDLERSEPEDDDTGDAATGSGMEYDVDAFIDPSLIRIEPDSVSPGDTANVFFPEGTERGIHFVLEEKTDDGWRHVFHLASAEGVHQGEMIWAPADEAFGAMDVAVSGSGPDVVPIPDTAAPGRYRICTANTHVSVCGELSITEST